MHIIGSGIIGLCSAWYLKKAGYDVTVIGKNADDNGCSFGNSGLIVPSHSAPLASPGVISKGIRWMFQSGSPFFIRPRLDLELFRWLWRFYRSCNKEHVARSMPVLRDFHLLSKSLYQEFDRDPRFAFDLGLKGGLMLCRTEKALHEEQEGAEAASAIGLKVSVLSADEVRQHDPSIRMDVVGGILYHDDAHLYPSKFIMQLRKSLTEAGVQFMYAEVTDFKISNRKIASLQLSDGSSVQTEEIICCAGAWSARLMQKAGLRLLIQDGKGYSITLKDYPLKPSIPAILTEARVAVTPMGNDLRIGGTLEVSKFSTHIDHVRVNAILKAMSTYYPDFPKLRSEEQIVWYGYRPVSADGLPYIGRSKKLTNLILATGHQMLGLSLGPATGLLVSEIVQEKKTSVPVELFAAERHG